MLLHIHWVNKYGFEHTLHLGRTLSTLESLVYQGPDIFKAVFPKFSVQNTSWGFLETPIFYKLEICWG